MRNLSLLFALLLFEVSFSQVNNPLPRYNYPDSSYFTLESSSTPKHIVYRKYSAKDTLLTEEVYWSKSTKITLEQFEKYRNSSYNFKKNGVSKQYYSNGILKKEGNYVMGIVEGPFTEYYPSGKKKLRYTFEKGEHVDKLINYYESGQIHIEHNYKPKSKVSYSFLYYPNGNLQMSKGLKNGKDHGTLKTYYPNGKIRRKEKWEDDSLISATCYGINGLDTTFYKRCDYLTINSQIQSVKKLCDFLNKKSEICSTHIVIRIGKEGEIIHIKPNMKDKNLSDSIKLLIKDNFTFSPLIFERKPVVSEAHIDIDLPINIDSAFYNYKTTFNAAIDSDYWLIIHTFSYQSNRQAFPRCGMDTSYYKPAYLLNKKLDKELKELISSYIHKAILQNTEKRHISAFVYIDEQGIIKTFGSYGVSENIKETMNNNIDKLPRCEPARYKNMPVKSYYHFDMEI